MRLRVACVAHRPWVAGIVALVALASIGAVGSPRAVAGGDDQQRGVALIARATQLENVLSPETGPFRLRVHVRLFGLVEGTREGEVLLMAASPAVWFESVRFPGYTELAGAFEGKRWRKRNVVDKPFRFYEVSQLLDLARHMRLPADAEIGRLAEEKVGGVQALCVDASPTAALWQKDTARTAAKTALGVNKDSKVTLCFDPASGVLLRAAYGGDLPRFEYEGQVALGNKVYPKVLRCFEGKSLAVEASVTDFSVSTNTEPGGFAPPEGADTWPECDAPAPPRLLEKKPLEDAVLAHARAKRAFGTITCLAEVATDGTVHDLAAVEWRGMLGQLVMDAVKGWRYAPAACNGVPVPMQIYIAYTFTP